MSDDLLALIDAAAPPGDPERRAWCELNDSGNAQRLVLQHGALLRHVPELGWLAWADTHWSAAEGQARAMQAARATVDAMSAEIAALKARAKENAGDAEMLAARAGALRKHQVTSGNSSKLNAMLEVAQADLRTTLDDFDRDPWALNVLNGTLRFSIDARRRLTITLDGHRADDMISKICNVIYDSKAFAPTWEAHLNRVLPDTVAEDGEPAPEEPAARRLYFARIMGYTLTGLTREQKFFLQQGRGGDGKSTAIGVIRRVLGTYAATADIRSFMQATHQKGGSEASPDMARLAGDVRLVTTSEPPKGAKFNDGLLKIWTGGGMVAARHLSKGIFEFSPRGKLMIEMNAPPGVGDDDGIWRRVSLLTWPVQITAEERDRDLEMKLFAEAPGVLNWMIAGLEDYAARGLAEPEEIVAAIEAYRAENDDVGEWMRERCERDDKAIELAATLFADYSAWCEERGFQARSQKSFGTALQLRGIRQTVRSSGSGKTRRKGARLLSVGALADTRGDAPSTLNGSDAE